MICVAHFVFQDKNRDGETETLVSDPWNPFDLVIQLCMDVKPHGCDGKDSFTSFFFLVSLFSLSLPGLLSVI